MHLIDVTANNLMDTSSPPPSFLSFKIKAIICKMLASILNLRSQSKSIFVKWNYYNSPKWDPAVFLLILNLSYITHWKRRNPPSFCFQNQFPHTVSLLQSSTGLILMQFIFSLFYFLDQDTSFQDCDQRNPADSVLYLHMAPSFYAN